MLVALETQLKLSAFRVNERWRRVTAGSKTRLPIPGVRLRHIGQF